MELGPQTRNKLSEPSEMSRNSDSGVSLSSAQSRKMPLNFTEEAISKSDLVRAWLDQLEITSKEDMDTVAELLKEISSVEQKKNCELQLGKLAQVLVSVRKKSKSEYVGGASLLVGAACQIGAFLLNDRPAASLLRATAAAAAAVYLVISLRSAAKSWKLRKEVILLLENEEFQEGVNLLFEELKKAERGNKDELD